MARLKISLDPDAHLIPKYELWKHVAEVYSKTALTKEYDKLIALSGIAKMMPGMTQDQYVTGVCRKYLASEFLWYMESSAIKDNTSPFQSAQSIIVLLPPLRLQ